MDGQGSRLHQASAFGSCFGGGAGGSAAAVGRSVAWRAPDLSTSPRFGRLTNSLESAPNRIPLWRRWRAGLPAGPLGFGNVGGANSGEAPLCVRWGVRFHGPPQNSARRLVSRCGRREASLIPLRRAPRVSRLTPGTRFGTSRISSVTSNFGDFADSRLNSRHESPLSMAKPPLSMHSDERRCDLHRDASG